MHERQASGQHLRGGITRSDQAERAICARILSSVKYAAAPTDPAFVSGDSGAVRLADRQRAHILAVAIDDVERGAFFADQANDVLVIIDDAAAVELHEDVLALAGLELNVRIEDVVVLVKDLPLPTLDVDAIESVAAALDAQSCHEVTL